MPSPLAGKIAIFGCLLWQTPILRAEETGFPASSGTGPKSFAGPIFPSTPSTPPSSAQGVLLLRNGETIVGNITPAGDRYDVKLKTGEVRIKRSDVELLAHSLDECYLHRRRAVEGQVQEHLNLADWCLKQKLMSEAANEIASALQLEPKHPKIALLERRLELARHKPAEAAASTASQPQAVSGEHLDKMIRDLPDGVVENFTITIQPLLLNRCATAACHGPQSDNSFRLTRIPPGRPANRRTTQRNLHAALTVAGNSNESPLLTVPLSPHGAVKAPVFANTDSAQYRQLAAWVAKLHGRQESTATAVVPVTHEEPAAKTASADVPTAAARVTAAQRANRERLQKPASRTRPGPKAMTLGPRKVKAETVDAADVNLLDDEDAFDESEPKSAKPASTDKASSSPESGDPLDPEIFNRRFTDQQ